jgi:L-lysine exporter family protein LysE/ArgO
MEAVLAIKGFGTGLGLIVAIGAQNAFVLRQGLKREHVGAVVALCALADAVLMAAGIAGLGLLIQGMPSVLAAIRYGGAAFLAWYGYLALRRALAPQSLSAQADGRLSLKACLLLLAGFTWLNPHVYLDTVVLVGSLAHSQSAPSGLSPWWFGAGAMCASAVWFTALGYGARWLTPLFARPGAWRVLDFCIAAVMWALALSLVLV